MTALEQMKIAQAIKATRDRIEKTGETLHGGQAEQQLRGVRRTAAHIADHLYPNDIIGAVEFLRMAGYGGDHEIRIGLKELPLAITPQELDEPLTPKESELVAEMEEGARVRMLDRDRRRVSALRQELKGWSTPFGYDVELRDYLSDTELLALGEKIRHIMNR